MDSSVELSAANQIFKTAELCEMILEHLPMKDVLFANLLCREVKNIIKDSPKLQVKLFNRPSDQPNAATWLFGYKRDRLVEVVGEEKARLLNEAANAHVHILQVAPVIVNSLLLGSYIPPSQQGVLSRASKHLVVRAAARLVGHRMLVIISI